MPTTALERVRAEAMRLDNIRTDALLARYALREAIQAARHEGHSLAEIGEALGLSRQRVHALSK